jgi:hypothetical protein
MNTNIVFKAKSELISRINLVKSSTRISSLIIRLIFIILIILKNPLLSCTNAHSSFYNKILNDYDTTSYFIAVDINSPFYKGRTIIENNNLYQYLHKTKGYDKEKYIYFMKSTLRHHRALKITDKDVIDWKFKSI